MDVDHVVHYLSHKEGFAILPQITIFSKYFNE